MADEQRRRERNARLEAQLAELERQNAELAEYNQLLNDNNERIHRLRDQERQLHRELGLLNDLAEPPEAPPRNVAQHLDDPVHFNRYMLARMLDRFQRSIDELDYIIGMEERRRQLEAEGRAMPPPPNPLPPLPALPPMPEPRLMRDLLPPGMLNDFFDNAERADERRHLERMMRAAEDFMPAWLDGPI